LLKYSSDELTVEAGIENNIKKIHRFTNEFKSQSTIVLTMFPLIAASLIEKYVLKLNMTVKAIKCITSGDFQLGIAIFINLNTLQKNSRSTCPLVP